MSAQGEGLTKNIEVLHDPLPDLLSEYSNEQISLYGVTGTPEELIKMCPVPHENMTTEAKNMFLVMAMNESAAEVKQEHMLYFQKVIESRGAELKVTLRHEPEHSSTKSTSAETLLDHLSNSTEEIIEQHTETLPKTQHATANALEARNKEQEESLHAQNEKVFKHSADYLPEEALTQDKTTTKRMDEWLTQLRIEYETRELANKSEADVEQSQVIQEEEMGGVARARPQEIQQPGEHDELEHSAEPETRNLQPKVVIKPLKVLSEGVAFTEPDKPDRSIHSTNRQSLFNQNALTFPEKDTKSATTFTEETFNAREIKMSSGGEDSGNIFANVDEDMPEKLFFYPAEISKSTIDIAPLMSRAENERDATETISFNELLPDAQEFQPIESQNVLDEIDRYIESDEALEDTDKLNIKSVIMEVEFKTRKLIELYSSTQETSPEETDELEISLREACIELFACLGIRHDEETIDWFINTIIQQRKSSESEENTTGNNRHCLNEEKRASELKRAFFFKLSFPQIEVASLRFLGYFALKGRHLVT